jgi:hypothetical protein
MESPTEYDFASLGESPRTVAQARGIARLFLAVVGVAPDADQDAVLMVVSELVGNAIRHAGGVTGFNLATRRGDILVTVEDASAELPHPVDSDPAVPGGFGYQLLSKLTRATWVHPQRCGKNVNALLPLRRALAHT